MNKERAIEVLFLSFLLGLLLWLGMGAYHGHKLDNGYPIGFSAIDSFYKYERAVHLDRDSDNTLTSHYLFGGVQGMAEAYPFLFFHNPVLLKDSSGIELYSTYYFLKVFYTAIAALIMYLVIRKYSLKLAVLSTGVFAFLFVKNFYTPFIYGWEPEIFGSFLLVLSFWTIVNYELNGFNILMGIFIGAAFLAHPPEALFAVLVFGAYFVVNFIMKKFDMKYLARALISGLVVIAIIAYYLPLFLSNYIGAREDVITASPQGPSFPVPHLKDFGFTGWIIIAGFILMGVVLFTKKGKNWEYFTLPLLMAIVTWSVLFISVNHNRFYQNRYYWPIYLSIFFGLAIYLLLQHLPFKIPPLTYYIIPIVVLLITAVFFYNPPESPGLIYNQEMWQGFEWVNQNVPEEKTVLAFYGDSYNQHAILIMFGHVVYHTDWIYLMNNIGYDLSGSLSLIEKKEVSRYYTSRPFIHGKDRPKREGFLDIKYIDLYDVLGLEYEKVNGTGRGFEKRDICKFDYIVFDKVSRVAELSEYNMLVRGALIKKGNYQEIFANSWYSVLRNNKVGETCI